MPEKSDKKNARTNIKEKEEELRAALQRLPKIDKLLELEEIREIGSRLGRFFARDVCREAVERAKERILGGDEADVSVIVEAELAKAVENARLKPFQPVVNATGIVMHTNLGRAPYGRELLEEAFEMLRGGTALEIDLVTGRRGVRGDFVREMAARLCGAEDALIVNNNAAALLLALSCLASGREVLVSRGELIQIGGGFRIPDIIRQGGAKLREVGTTNITTLSDYENAMSEETGALLKVHLSNFHLDGFVERPATGELAALKREDLPLIEDLGSGCLIEEIGGRRVSDPTPGRVLSSGADLVCMSGDKLIGGPQAGIIAGKACLIEKLARFPLMRAIRPGKFTYAMLQIALRRYALGESESMAPWRFLKITRESLRERAENFRLKLGLDPREHPVIDSTGEFGAGSLPGELLESVALVVASQKANAAAEAFRRSDPPVIGIIRDGRFLLDFLCIDPDEEPALLNVARSFLKKLEI